MQRLILPCKMRIFIGLTDIARITANYSKGFRALGHEVFSVVWSKSHFYKNEEYELVIDERGDAPQTMGSVAANLRLLLQLIKIFRGLDCDVFILFAPAVLPNHLYYPLLKFLGKKIITAFWGSDIRYWYAFAEEMRSLGSADEVSPFFDYARTRSGGSYWDKRRTVSTAEKYSDLIISQPDCGQLQVEPYMRSAVPLDLSEYHYRVPGRIRPLVVHAPSVPEAKGTDVVMRVIEELHAEGLEFDFRLIKNMPNREIRELLSESDIVVDELYSATVAGLSAEAMATGNVVLVRYMAEYSRVPGGCPAVNVNIFTLKETLRDLILDVKKRTKIASLGRAYVEKENDHIRLCEKLLEWLQTRDTLTYDFTPTFYRQLQIPPPILEDEMRNRWQKRTDFYRLLINGASKKNSA